MSSRPEVRFLDRTTPPHIVTLVCMASFGPVSMTLFLPSLPAMTAYFGTEYGIMQLSVTLYMAVIAPLQLIIGSISDRFGRRKLILASIVVFLLATLGCIYAPSIEIFLTFRMFQSSAAACMVLSRAIIRDMVPQEEAASMIGWVTMGMSLVPMFAPAIGGFAEETFGWQASFWLMIIFGVCVFVLCWLDQGETSFSGGRSFRDQLSEYPELFRSHRFWGYILSAAFSSGVFFAFLGGAPYVATEIYGLSSTGTGIGFGVPATGYLVGNYISARFSVRFGINFMVITGCAITAAGMALAFFVSAAGFSNAWIFFGLCSLIGIGNGMTMPNATAGLLSVRPHLAGSAAGFGNAFMIGGGAALSAGSGAALSLGGGDLPLIAVMLLSALCALACSYYVVIRERRLGVA